MEAEHPADGQDDGREEDEEAGRTDDQAGPERAGGELDDDRAGGNASPDVQISEETLRAIRKQINASLVPLRRVAEEAARSFAARMPRIDPAALNLPRLDVPTVISEAMQEAMREQNERIAAQFQSLASTIDLSGLARPVLPPGWKESVDRFITGS